MGSEDPVGLCQGMDHALMSDSSKRPGENDRMKGLCRYTQRFRVADLEPDLPSYACGQQPIREFDLAGVRVDADDAADNAGNPPSEPSVTAPDIQDPSPAKGRMAQEHSHFQPFRIP